MVLFREARGQTDEQLVERIKQGDDEAFYEIVHRYQQRLVNVAYRILGNWEDAQEVTQNVFVQVHKNASTFRGDSAFYTWLYCIACRQALNALRSRKTREKGLGVLLENLTSWLRRSEAGPHASLLGSEVERQLEEALAKLDERYRVPLVLRVYENMSYDEIATVLDRPVGTVSRQINEGRRQLRALLGALSLV